MSWLRIEGRMPHHRKVAPLSDAAFRLHVTAQCWCVEEENDGAIPRKIPGTLQSAPKGKALDRALKDLVESGLWDITDGGYAIHDYLDYNPTAAESAARRASKVAAGSAGGRVKASKRLAPASSLLEQTPGSEVANGQHGPKQNPSPTPTPTPTLEVVVGASQVLPSEIQAKARKVLDNPHDGQYSVPSKWPEVQLVAAAWSHPFGIREPKLRDFPDGDSDLKAILQALADGYPIADLVAAGEKAKANGYFAKQERPGPASFTAAVLRRLLADKPEQTSAMVWDEDAGRMVSS